MGLLLSAGTWFWTVAVEGHAVRRAHNCGNKGEGSDAGLVWSSDHAVAGARRMSDFAPHRVVNSTSAERGGANVQFAPLRAGRSHA
jgi:hypothetical protein